MSCKLIFQPDQSLFPFLFIDCQSGLPATIRIKHDVYDKDPSSGYGLAFSLTSVKASTGVYKGIPLTLAVSEQIMTEGNPAYLNEDPWFSYIQRLADIPLLPAPDGSWFFKAVPIPVPSEIHVSENGFMNTYRTGEVNWQTWLIRFFSGTQRFMTERQRMIHDLKLYANYDTVSDWIKHIHDGSQSAPSLPVPYYNLALQVINQKPQSDIYQMELILHEPDNDNQTWYLAVYLRELSQNRQISHEDVVRGRHPFATNPCPFMKQSLHHVLRLFSKHGLHVAHEEGRISLGEEDMVHFVEEITRECQAMGINCWLPSSLKQPPDLAIRMHLSEKDTASPGPWVTSDMTWTLTLNNEEMEQKLFRQLVEEERRVIHFHDHWYLWNQKDARQLLRDADQMKAQTLLFRGMQQQAMNEEKSSASPTTCSQGHKIDVNELFKQIRTHADAKIEEPWGRTLRYYQQQGLIWLLGMRRIGVGAILADDMGLGKSRQIMAYIDHIMQRDETSRFLIVCPSSLLHHWELELSVYFSEEQIRIHDGPVTKRREQFHESLFYSQKIHVVSFATLVRDCNLFESVSWTALIIDEAQKIKNPRTLQHKAAADLSAAHVIALTGTPVENHPEELISLSELINPGYLPGSSEPEYDALLKPVHIKRLLRPMMLRRTKQEVQEDLHLPEKHHHHHSVSLSFEQEILYKAVVEELFDQYQDATEPVKRAALFKTMMKLKQICNHPAQAKKELGPERFIQGRSPKWDMANALLKKWQLQGKRGIIFTQFRYAGHLFQEMQLNQRKPSVPFLHGGLTAAQRKDMIRSFKDDQNIPFMIISLRAGGFGLNLTEASAVLHFDRWWNPAVEDQATDRVHRIGQQQPVDIHTMTTEGTIEARIDDLIRKKRQLQEALIDGRPLPLWTLSEDELKDLFSLPSDD